jgi:vWA domain found in the FtsH ternary systems/N-terminal helical region fused to the FtsH ternary system vWA domain
VVLGKLDSDPTLGRASDALARYRGRDFERGLAFVIERTRSRSRAGGVLINPVALKPDLGRSAEQILEDGWESLERDGPMPILLDLYGEWIKSFRDLAEALGPEDVFELEHGTALASFGQRLALRQVLQAAAEFEAGLPIEPPRPSGGRPEVSSRFLDEDAYPVGGFSSISTRGSLESLLHSQLVYMEPGERPDPFDIKFVRDELLYYSRDENQFLRRRRAFLFVLSPDLAGARIKDPGLPRQRIVLLLGLIVAAIRRLSLWLGEDSLSFEVVFVESNSCPALDQERELIDLILGESIARGEVSTSARSIRAVCEYAISLGRRNFCHLLAISMTDAAIEAEGVRASKLLLDGAHPRVEPGSDRADPRVEVVSLEAWQSALARLLGFWV